MTEKQRDLPEGWKIISLGDEKYFRRFGGSTPSKSHSDYWENGTIPWLSNTELKDNEINFVSSTYEKITQNGLNNCSASLLPRKCVLLTCTASIGKVGINDIELATNQQFNSFQCSEEVLPKYLAFFLLTQKDNLTKLGGSTSFCHINTKNLGTLKIPLPPLSIQRQIVAVLEEAEALKRQRQEADVLMGALLQSVFYEMFGDPVRNEKGWPVKKFGDIIINLDEKRIPIKKSEREITNRLYPYYGASGIIDYVDDFIFDGDFLLIGEDGANLLARSTPIAFRASGKIWVNNHAHILQSGKETCDIYLEFFINSIDLKKYVSGSAQPKLTQKSLNGIEIPLPPLALQQQFARVVEDMERIRKSQVESGREIEGLCEGLMARAFAGELMA